MARIDWTPAQVAEIVAAYQAGESCLSIAPRYSVSKPTIRDLLKRHGVRIRGLNELHGLHWTDAQRAAIVAAYQAGQTAEAIGAAFGGSQTSVYPVLKAAGVARRTSGLRRHACDEGFFDTIDNEEKAYWLGFFSADGDVEQHRISIGLARKDVAHLERFRAALRAEHPIELRTSTVKGKTHETCRVRIGSARLCAALFALGVTRRKSHTIEPATVRPDLVRHYWRGVFDGDGCLSRANARTVRINLALVGSRAMVQGFADFLRDQRAADVSTRPKSRVFTCAVFERGAVRRACRLLYDGATVALERKLALAVEAIAYPVANSRSG